MITIDFRRPTLEDKELLTSYFRKYPSRSCERTFVKYPVTAFIFPVNMKSPIKTISIPPTFTVYFTTFICFFNSSRRLVVNSPSTRNGSTNPSVYTPINANPIHFVPADAAIKSTLVNAGPTHGVHAKLNVNPISSAVSGDIASTSR